MEQSKLFRNFNGDIVPPHGELLRQQAQHYGDRIYAIIDDESISFSGLYRQALKLAKSMHLMGLGPGDKVGVLMPNCIDFMVAYFAAHLLGAAVVTVNARFKSHELAHVIGHADIRLLFTTDRIDEHVSFCDLLSETFPELDGSDPRARLGLEEAPALEKIVLFGESHRVPFIPVAEFEGAGVDVPEQAVNASASSVGVDDVAVILFTSGTTAMPKACQISHRSIYQTWVKIYPKAAALKCGEKIWVPMPCFHIGGIGLTATTMAHGACFLSSIHHDPLAALELIRSNRPEYLYPGFFTILLPVLTHPSYTKSDFSFVHNIVAVADYETHIMMKNLMPEGIEVFQLFGMSEAGGFVSFAGPDMPEELRLKSHGMPIEDCEVRIADEKTDSVLPVGADGEIQFRGPNAFRSYYKDEEATRRSIIDGGWVKTGDHGRLDENGALTYLGRIKDMLKVGGENVAASEIESYLDGHPAVKIAQVVAKKDSYYGEVPVAFIELMEDRSVEKHALMDFCRGKLASFKVPRDVIFVTEWPMSATKIQKYKLRQMLE